MQSPLSITPAPMSPMKPYSNLDTIKRDASLEANLELAWREPSAAERGELEGLLRKAADFLQVPYEPPIARGLVLAGDLTAHQRAEIDRVYVPRYSAALEKDEAAREGFAFVECGERMADLRKGADERGLRVMWSSTPFNAACGEFAGKPRIFWSRQSVAELFWRACAAFNAIGLTPQVEDGYRPPAVQEGLFRRRVKMVRDENPELGVADVLREVAAKTATSPLRAAHMAGAAIDFTLREVDGQPL
ncbi:MAG: hypothetical protein J0M12_13360, partial [Deltaproteobacteria bacterium]|nr:hypothetical protein [Deltaproteobacteria bacterium]